MVLQTDLSLENTFEASERIRSANRAADDIAERACGLKKCIARYEQALRENTYPLVGRGEPLLDEHRPHLEATVAGWKKELKDLELA